MTHNQDISTAWEYHQATKHSYASVQSSSHTLDWDNRPDPFKRYLDLEPIPLPVELPDTGHSMLAVLEEAPQPANADSLPSLAQLAYLLYYTAGLTKKAQHPDGPFYFRAAACAGALYPVEIYVVCGPLPDLPAGVYHFSPLDFALRRLRSGDFRSVLVEAAGQEPGVSVAPVTLVFTAITWRSAWKYRSRAYRYHFWDSGTMLANALAAAQAQRLPARVVLGFVDDRLNRLLGLEGDPLADPHSQEKSLALLPVGRVDPPSAGQAELPRLDLRRAPLSAAPQVDPLIEAMHAASHLADAEAVRRWREQDSFSKAAPAKAGPILPLDLSEGHPGASLEDVIARRGSSRRFQPQPIAFQELSRLLASAVRPIQFDGLGPDGPMLNDLYLNIHAVEGIPPGSYYYDPAGHALHQLRAGSFRGDSAYLCLGQDLGGASAATVFFLSPLNAVLERFGNRGYRAVQAEAGILGGRLYLAAYALRRGATGLTFFDDDVVRFFSPHAAGKEPIFVTALGVPAKVGRRLAYLSPGEK